MAEKIPTKYRIVELDRCPQLNRSELEKLLKNLPIDFCFAHEETSSETLTNARLKGTMEVYHFASVISLYPEDGYRLSCATVTNHSFPLVPDNIMDDNLGLRCCFHPKISSFGIKPDSSIEPHFRDSIEIDIHKFPKATAYRQYRLS